MIYETSTELVPLEKEIVYLENYVALQKMSLSKEVELTCTVTGDSAGKLIEPMLLIPLVENVFKHGITYRHPVKVSIQINITGNVIELVTRNPLTENRFPDTDRKGIGLVNLKKRLNLHYRGKHELQTGIEDKDFITHLKIWLE
jgi:sensor histidine kinase YesM